MKRKRTILIKFVLFILIFSSVGVGCSVKNDILQEDDNEEEISINVGGKDYELLVRSEGISDLVVDIYGIDNATSIIFNDMVVVGVEMAEGFTLTDELKETIMNSILENDPMIRQVLISDNKKIFDEIEEVIESLMNGKPYDDQVKEINRIIEKLKKE
ncbi:MAG: hypothetical protein GX320_06885 [Tissierellia bacterium]|nr:hypothetical protein [Tissierellia bacterium]